MGRVSCRCVTMPPRSCHLSAAGRGRPAAWPPPARHAAPSPQLVPMRRLLALALLVLLLSSSHGADGAPAAEPRLLGCRVDSTDRLLPLAALSAPSGGGDCLALCGQQAALLAAVSPRWCFCLNQLTAAADLTANCSGSAPAGLELLHVFALTQTAAPGHGGAAPAPSSRSSQRPESPELFAGAVWLVFKRCALRSGAGNAQSKGVDDCVHYCDTKYSGGVVALGPSAGTSVQYECHCSAEDGFGDSLDADTCDEHCERYSQTMETTCGGFTEDGAEALSVYQLTYDTPVSTPTPLTTRSSTSHSSSITGYSSSVTGHSSSVSGGADDVCPDRGVQVAGGSCYRTEAVHSSKPGDSPTYADAVTACSEINDDGSWRVWAVDTEAECHQVYATLLVQQGYLQDDNDVITSGMVQPDGSTVRWDGWPQAPPADWLAGHTSGTPKSGSVLVWHGIQGAYDDTEFVYHEQTELPDPLAVICELPSAGTTVTTPETTTATSPTTPSTTTASPVPSTAPPTPDPAPQTPDDAINGLIDDLNRTSESNITDTDIIDAVDQLEDILNAQLNMSESLSPEERLASDRQFTLDLVQLVDTLLRATDAWQNMTQSESEDTSRKLMYHTEAAGFLLANSTVVAENDTVFETVQPSLILSASSVNRGYNGTFQFPASVETTCWISLPAGYSQFGQSPTDRVPQVGLLYRSEVMALLLSPANNSMNDHDKKLNSPVLSFSLGGVGQRVQFPGGRTGHLHLQYTLTERQPRQQEVWRHLHPGEQPSAVAGTAVCAYWNDTLSEWSTDGCQMQTVSSSKHHASCACSHLTSFAILMNYHDYVGTPPSLNILTWVLGSLSVIGLVVTWIVFTCDRSLRCCRTTITRHMSAMYAVGLVLLLTVMDRRLVYLEPATCTAVGMAVHYCFLSVFCWSMVEGIHLYKVLRHVFEPKSNSMARYYMYGYLVPAIIIVITNGIALGVDEDAYVRDEFCWLTVPYFIWFFNGPIAVILMMNTFVLILAYRSAAMLKVNQLRAKKEKVKRWLKGWFCLSCLLGVQWAIGYIYVDGSNVFDYVFTALNCSQGLLIFIFHCLLRQRTRQILLGRFSADKRSTMMNSVYGQMVIAQRKTQEYRQSRMSHDTCVTTLSNGASPANSESADSSPASERSSSSSEDSGRSGRSMKSASRRGRPSLSKVISADSQTNGSLKGRVNLAFQAEEPRPPLPDISEESDSGSPRHTVPLPGRGSRSGCPPSVVHTDSVEIYRSHSIGALRHGKVH